MWWQDAVVQLFIGPLASSAASLLESECTEVGRAVEDLLHGVLLGLAKVLAFPLKSQGPCMLLLVSGAWLMSVQHLPISNMGSS